MDQHADFDPLAHYRLTVAAGELSEVERNAYVGAAPTSVDDIVL